MKVCLKENCAIYNLLLLVFPSFLVHISIGKCNKWQCFVQRSSVCSALFEVFLQRRISNTTLPSLRFSTLCFLFTQLFVSYCEHHTSSKERKKERNNSLRFVWYMLIKWDTVPVLCTQYSFLSSLQRKLSSSLGQETTPSNCGTQTLESVSVRMKLQEIWYGGCDGVLFVKKKSEIASLQCVIV